jgi:hypothetical protein
MRSWLLKTVYTDRDAAERAASRAREQWDRAEVEPGIERAGAATWRVRVWHREPFCGFAGQLKEHDK